MSFTLPPLPYPADALEAAIDKTTMEIHHGKHHKVYVDNLNAAVAGHPDLERKPIEQLLRDISGVPEAIRQKVINNGGGHANHTMFWEIMGPRGGGEGWGRGNAFPYPRAARARTSAARSTSSEVVNRPTVRRRDPRPTSGGTRMAQRTGDCVTCPSWQAEPVEAASSGTRARS